MPDDETTDAGAENLEPQDGEQEQPASESADAAEGAAEEALDAAQEAIDEVDGGDAADAQGDNAGQEMLSAVQDAINAVISGEDAPATAAAAAEAAQDAVAAAHQEVATQQAVQGGEPVELPNFGEGTLSSLEGGMDLLSDVNLNMKIELGRTRMHVDDVLRLGEGSVVELDKLAGDPVDVYVNDRPVARGEVLVLNENFCIRINEILTTSSN